MALDEYYALNEVESKTVGHMLISHMGDFAMVVLVVVMVMILQNHLSKTELCMHYYMLLQ